MKKSNTVAPATSAEKTESPFLAIRIIRLASLLTTVADKILLKKCQLTHAQFSVMMTITCLNTASQTDIAHQLKLTTAAVSRLTDILVEKKLITRTIDPHNRRANIVRLTAIGKKRLHKAITILQAAEQTLFGSLPEQKVFFSQIEFLSDKLDSSFH